MATDANMNVIDYGFEDDDDDYYSCLSEMAPIASSENIFGFRTGIESGQFFDCKLVSAKFDQDEKRFSQEPGMTNVLDIEEGELLSAHLLADEDNTGHGTYVEDIPLLPSEKESTDGDLLTGIRRKFQLPVPSEEVPTEDTDAEFVVMPGPECAEILAINSGHVSLSPSRISSSDKDILVTWKCQKFFDNIVESFDEESEKGIVSSDCVIAENNITGSEHEVLLKQYREEPFDAVHLSRTPAVTDLDQSSPELTKVWKKEDKVSPTSVVIGIFLVRTVSENALRQPLQKKVTVLKPGTSDNSGLDYFRDDSGIYALDKPPVERIPESGTGNEDDSSTEKATKKKGFFRSLLSCICPCLRKKNPKMKTSDKVAKKL